MSSIYDVAKLAGVSKTLVSRVINGQTGVSEASRAKIEAAMKELHFRPSAIARSLVLQKTNIIGVIVDTLCEPYYFDFIKGIEQEIEASNYEVIFCSARNRIDAKIKYIDFFSQGRADGYIVYGSNMDDEVLLNRMEGSDFPSVVVENSVKGKNINNICVDNRYGSEMAVRHLFEQGCRSIWYVTGDMTVNAAIERKEGYVNAMMKQGVIVTQDMLFESQFNVEAGYRTVSALLQKVGRSGLPDALYFGADNTAAGGMMALMDAGVSIPEDIRIVGFDNDRIVIPDRSLKKLTTVAQPMFDMGVSAARLLIQDIRECSAEKKKVVYYPQLLVRETT